MVLQKTSAALATAILTAGLATVGVGAVSGADAATPTATGTTAAHCHPLKGLPTALRTDLRAARKLPVGQRAKAVRTVRQKALHGGYGAKAEAWAVHRIRHLARVRAHEPKVLRQALRAVHELPAAQRPAARKAIHAKVLSGGYGAAAQKRAERVKAHREACRAK